MRNVRSAGEYAVACVGVLAALVPACTSFDMGSVSSWLKVSLLSLLLAFFAILCFASLRKRDLGYTERVFKYPRGVDSTGPNSSPLSNRRAKRVKATDSEIRTWMLEHLERSSSATVFTRDLSWAASTDTEFADQSKDFRIIACIDGSPSEPQLQHLRAIGATPACNVYLYKIGTSARFTWFTIGTNEFVAVALPQGRRHVIRWTDNPKDPAYRLAKAVRDSVESPKMTLLTLDETAGSELDGTASP